MAYIAVPYQLFFLYIEPISTLAGAYYASCQKSAYLDMTHLASSPTTLLASASADPFDTTLIPGSVPLGTSVVLSQLANMYFVFALLEGGILRVSSDLRVWRMLLIALLIADFGHLYACAGLGWEYLYQIDTWDAMAWGNIGFVYIGATLRLLFLIGVGVVDPRAQSKANSNTTDSAGTNRPGGKSKLR